MRSVTRIGTFYPENRHLTTSVVLCYDTSMNKPQTLGDQELTLLRYVTDHAPITVREVAEKFGEPHGLARTTILTMMERLRQKNYLTRFKDQSAFQYQPVVAKTELMQSLVKDFVEKSLGGSLSPFVAYLSESKNLSEREMADLRRLVSASETEGS